MNNKSVLRSSPSHVSVDQGLRAFMLRVYNLMFIGLGVTAVVSYFLMQSPSTLVSLMGGPMWIILFAQLGLVFYFAARLHKMAAQTAKLIFFVYATLMGLSLSPLLYMYTGVSVFRVFLITSATFGSMSLYGYTTKRDLSQMGSLLFMGLIGIIIAGVVNIFMNSSGLSFLISILAVIIFTGLTAYDTQRIKEIYHEADSQEDAERKAVNGALMLYLDFMNLFINLLRLLGDRR